MLVDFFLGNGAVLARCSLLCSMRWAEVAGKAAVYKVDIDQSLDLAQRYGIMSVPTLMVFEGGQVKRTAMEAARATESERARVCSINYWGP